MNTVTTALDQSAMLAIEQRVATAPEATDFCKRVVLYLLRRSKGLTKPVCLHFSEETRAYGEEAVHGVHDMCSVQSITQLHKFMNGFSQDTWLSSLWNSNGFGVWLTAHFTLEEVQAAKALPLDIQAIMREPMPG